MNASATGRLSPTFCVLPWLHQMVTTEGDAGFCCVGAPPSLAGPDGRLLSLREGGFDAAWNSAPLKDIRRRMAAGEAVAACETCYFQERNGKKSHRQHHNGEWEALLGAAELDRRVAEGAARGHALESRPVYLHLCLGNLCNLKCRMCNPASSSLIEREQAELAAREGAAGARFWSPARAPEEGAPWHEREPFWSAARAAIPALKKIYVTGGEPTLSPGVLRFFRNCIDAGRAPEIELLLNTNCTALSDEFIALLGRFKKATVCASLDGVGAAGEYIRYPSRWEVVDRNLRRLLERAGPSVDVFVTPVTQVYNALELPALLDYVAELERASGRRLTVYLLDCLSPRYLSVAILPRAVKAEAARRLEEFRRRSPVLQEEPASDAALSLRDGIESLLAQLRQDAPADAPRLLADFVYYTKTLDRNRGQDLAAALPRLAELLRAEGVPL